MDDKAMGKMMTGMFTMMMVLIGLSMAVGFIPEQVMYCCPLCDECFTSEEELIAHFETAHPSQPIDIIWD